MEYHLTYRSTNLYDRPTPEVYLDFLILPAEQEGRKLTSYTIRTSPKNRYIIQPNNYGFNLIRFMHLVHLVEFRLEMTCTVSVDKPFPMPDLNREQQSTDQVLQSDNFRRRNYFFLHNTELTKLERDTLEKCLRQEAETIIAYVKRLKGHVYSLMSYVPGVTDSSTTARESLVVGKGVCQDFTHIFIGFCRHAGIPCRYASGYLYVGENKPAQLHAWAEVLVPGLGWLGVDPTNHLLTNENYIKIAHGIDYSECASIRGIIRGVINHTTDYEVAIQQIQQ